MKRTTYIIFGMLLTGLVVVCAGMFYASTQVTGWERYHLYQDTLRRFNRELARLMKKLLPGVSVSSYTAKHNTFAI